MTNPDRPEPDDPPAPEGGYPQPPQPASAYLDEEQARALVHKAHGQFGMYPTGDGRWYVYTTNQNGPTEP